MKRTGWTASSVFSCWSIASVETGPGCLHSYKNICDGVAPISSWPEPVEWPLGPSPNRLQPVLSKLSPLREVKSMVIYEKVVFFVFVLVSSYDGGSLCLSPRFLFRVGDCHGPILVPQILQKGPKR